MRLSFFMQLQVVELDFLYPSEGIHRRWEHGYRITSSAATIDQAAFILSKPKRKPVDETQETLRTTAFPSNHVKVSPGIIETLTNYLGSSYSLPLNSLHGIYGVCLHSSVPEHASSVAVPSYINLATQLAG
jgi:hypothetical protein